MQIKPTAIVVKRRMKKNLLMFIALFGFICVMQGQNERIITIAFDNIPLKDALLKLEDKTNYFFYFEEVWLKDHRVTKNYNNRKIRAILNELFEETSLNYFIKDNRIILLNNAIVLEQLPFDFFDEGNLKEEIQDRSAPIFQEEFLPKGTNRKRGPITIGKQNPNTRDKEFTISGRVTNMNNNEPVQNLSIFTIDREIYTNTDSDGFYSFKLPQGLNRLETNLLGYEKVYQDLIIYGNGAMNLEISEDVEVLDEVVVESKKNANVRDAVVGASIINVEGIKTIPLVLGERDMLKAALTLPGIKTAGEGSGGLNVRGGRADQNLMLLDDIVIYNPTHFLGLFSAINPFTTQSLEIYKASIPAEYGGRLSSVFDIETKIGNTEKISGEGSIGPITANLALEVPLIKKKASIIAGFRATYADYILKNLDEESLNNSEASFYDGIVKYSHDVNENNSVQSTIYYSKDKFSITSDSVFGYSNGLVSLKWNHKFSEKSRASIIVGNSRYQYDILYKAEANNDFDFGYVLNESLFKVNLYNALSNKHKLSYGLSSKLYVSDPGTIKPIGSDSNVQQRKIDREKGLESALYISDLFEVDDKLLLDIGLRYSLFAGLGEASQNVYVEGVPKSEGSIAEVRNYGNNEVIKTHGGFEYRISGRYLLDKDLSLKAGFNRTLQYLHLLTTNTTMSPTDIWKLSDLNIKPQRADQYSIGIFKNIVENDLEFSLEGYYKKMHDLLDYKIGAQLILNDALETELLQGQGKAYGVEALIKKTAGRFNGYLGYSYSRALIKLNSAIQQEQVNNGDFFPANFDKPHDLSLIGNYRFNKRISASANFVYQTGRPITYPVGKFIYANEEQVLYSDRNQFRIPDYYRLDLGINIEGNHKKKKIGHSFVNISVYNVLGRNNPYSVFFVNEEGRIKAFKTSIFSIPVPTITYNFKF
ncbi:carboxypeptidase-like regulatory domain-containing protein [Maribacter sp. HTCC2170]|uniref:carboxypeptidase-like regulatory domain-containing protein n=1 Tax=Maribacter sp. (strain HTCC2170 / KCCM 42371) TaxID=313603 RepID=UPI00006BD356|nr:carboxypeptidase-like regulatory domain-containing protein [Maribacter sp. HTCC2170]EAR02916.1 putative TonB-dependent outer membrane receptor protein [Maribacter sp. HTCC2170]